MDFKATNNAINEASHETNRTSSEPVLYSYAFWDKRMLPKRKMLTGLLLLPVLYTTLLMWLCLSIYWGSLVDSNNVTKLKVVVVNLDIESFLGEQVISGIHKDILTNSNHLDWEFDNSIHSPEECQNIVLNEDAWGVLQSILLIISLDR